MYGKEISNILRKKLYFYLIKFQNKINNKCFFSFLSKIKYFQLQYQHLGREKHWFLNLHYYLFQMK